jgi:Holliday junction resolvasome RuvABC ATP-dependent DNA helicase subunit
MAEEDAPFELSLRPKRLTEYVGQKQRQTKPGGCDPGCKAARRSPGSRLLWAARTAETTLASVIANEMGSAFRATAGPLVQLKGDLTAILTNLEAGDILFIDEIHRLRLTSKKSSTRHGGLQTRHHHWPGTERNERIVLTCAGSPSMVLQREPA